MKARHLLLTVAVSFVGGFCAVLVLLNGALPRCTAECDQLNDPARTPCGNGDVNGSEGIDIADAIYLLSYLFARGPAPVALAQGGGLTPEQEEILSHFSMVDLPVDDAGTTARTIRISGVNVQIVNNMGSTSTVNGVGNLIVGYQEQRGGVDNRTGSHNIVVGVNHNYSSYGGLVVGQGSTISGPFSSVSGGRGNTASADSASVSGGDTNTANGQASSVSGGRDNTASGDFASVSGGNTNTAGGLRASVSGGDMNTASGEDASVSGGNMNTASGPRASVSGGRNNEASGHGASISGGGENTASEHCAAVSGGQSRASVLPYDWRAGELFQDQ